MSNYRESQIRARLAGEKKLAKITLQMLPLVKKHFEYFDGNRCNISTGGRSAAFKKVIEAFYAEVKETINNKTFRVYIDDSIYSVAVVFDIHEPRPGSDYGCDYFKQYLYCGKVDSQIFKYEFDLVDYGKFCKTMLATTLTQIKSTRAKIARLKGELNTLETSVPNAFRDLIT